MNEEKNKIKEIGTKKTGEEEIEQKNNEKYRSFDFNFQKGLNISKKGEKRYFSFKCLDSLHQQINNKENTNNSSTNNINSNNNTNIGKSNEDINIKEKNKEIKIEKQISGNFHENDNIEKESVAPGKDNENKIRKNIKDIRETREIKEVKESKENKENKDINTNAQNFEEIIKEEDNENEYSYSEGNQEKEKYDSNSNSYIDSEFCSDEINIREDNCWKLVISNIVSTYKQINPKIGYEEQPKTILTNPSVPTYNNNKDNEEHDLIVSTDDEIRSEKNIYVVKELLGKGVSSQVFKVMNKKGDNFYALKIIKNKENIGVKTIEEITLIQYLNKQDTNGQSHIIILYESFWYYNHLCIVLELLNENLFKLLQHNHLCGISLSSIRFISKQILEAVELIHKCKIVHTDLKPENILLTVDKVDTDENNNNKIKKNKITIKIADFGGSYFKNCGRELLKYVQSRYYRAPEVIIGLDYDEKIDIWSIGCISAELYLGLPLLPGISSYDQLSKIIELLGEFPLSMVQECKFKDKYFIMENNYYSFPTYRIKTKEEFNQNIIDNNNEEEQNAEIPFGIKTLDDLIDIKRENPKINNSLHTSMNSSHNNSIYSLNSSNSSEDLVAFIHFLKGMLQIDPKKRWNAKQCLRHPFLTKEKLDKFISFEPNNVSQFVCYSNNSNNNNCKRYNKKSFHSMMLNNSFTMHQNKNLQFLNNQNMLFNNNYFINNNQQKLNSSFNNYNYNYNNNNNFNYKSRYSSKTLQGGYFPNQNVFNNYQNNISQEKGGRLNSSFNSNNPNIYQVNLDKMRVDWLKKFPFPYAYIDNCFFSGPNGYSNNNFNNNNINSINNINNYNYITRNSQKFRHNNSFMESSFERLSSSGNFNNISQNYQNSQFNEQNKSNYGDNQNNNKDFNTSGNFKP